MLTALEELEQEAYDFGIHVDDRCLLADDPWDGLYICAKDGTHIILLNRFRPVSARTAVLAEELGHFHTAYGNIIDQTAVSNRKSEMKGRHHAYRRLIPKDVFDNLFKAGVRAVHEIADSLCLPEDFVKEAYAYYSVAG